MRSRGDASLRSMSRKSLAQRPTRYAIGQFSSAARLSSTERLNKKHFACLPTALRPSGLVQQWIFHQAEQELTTLPGLRYSSGHRKGRLKIVSIQLVATFNFVNPGG